IPTPATRSRSRSSAGRTRVAPEWPSSSNTHSSGTCSPSRCACPRNAAVCDAIVSSFFCRADDTRAYIAALVISRSSFLAGPSDAGPPLGYKNGVGHRQVRGRMTVEHEFGVDHTIPHRRKRFRCPDARNSVNACATTAEIVLPDSRARARTRATSAAGNLTVNTVVSSGTSAGPPAAARWAYRRAWRTEQPNRPASTRAASAGGTPAASSSAAALTRRAYSRPPTRPPAPPPSDMTLLYYQTCHDSSATHHGRPTLRYPSVTSKQKLPIALEGWRRLHAGHRLSSQRAPARLIPGS